MSKFRSMTFIRQIPKQIVLFYGKLRQIAAGPPQCTQCTLLQHGPKRNPHFSALGAGRAFWAVSGNLLRPAISSVFAAQKRNHPLPQSKIASTDLWSTTRCGTLARARPVAVTPHQTTIRQTVSLTVPPTVPPLVD